MIRSYGWGIRIRDGVWEERLLRDYAFVHGAILLFFGVGLAGTFLASGGVAAAGVIAAALAGGLAAGIGLGSREARRLETWVGGPARPRRSPIELLFLPLGLLASVVWAAAGLHPAFGYAAQGILAGYSGLLIGWPFGVARHERRTSRGLWVRDAVRANYWTPRPRGTVTLIVEPAGT